MHHHIFGGDHFSPGKRFLTLQYKELVDSIKDNTPYVDRRGISKVLPK